MGNETAGRASLFRRLATAVGTGAAGLVLVTGCAAGQNAQTVEQTPSIDGIQAEAGNIAIRAAGIVSPESGASYAKGSDAPLRMVLINRGGQADRLVSVSSPMASGAQLGSGSSGTATGAGSSATSASPSVSPSASASGTASGSASASSSDSATSSPSAAAASTPINLPPRESTVVGMGDGGASVTLTGLTADLFPAQSVPVTLTFASGTSVTITLAVQLSTQSPSAPTVSAATQVNGE